MSSHIHTGWLQFSVTVRDQGEPEKTATSQVYIRVQRDLREPRFESTPYRTSVSERLDVGASIFKLRGRDDDKMVSTGARVALFT